MSSFDNQWEKTYKNTNGKHLNKYPYGQLVTYFFRNLKNLPSKTEVRILELGCGVGNNLPLILNEGFYAYGIDGSESAISIAKNNFSNYSNLDLQVMDFTNIKYTDCFFDMIIDRQSIYANTPRNIEKIYNEVTRTLKKGGILISFMYNTNDYHYKKAINNDGYAKIIEYNTYTEFKGGTFKENGTVHFFTIDEVKALTTNNNLKILNFVENKIEQLIPLNENKLAEYILVAIKC